MEQWYRIERNGFTDRTFTVVADHLSAVEVMNLLTSDYGRDLRRVPIRIVKITAEDVTELF